MNMTFPFVYQIRSNKAVSQVVRTNQSAQAAAPAPQQTKRKQKPPNLMSNQRNTAGALLAPI